MPSGQAAMLFSHCAWKDAETSDGDGDQLGFA